MGMPISIIPSSVLEDIAKDWENGATATEVFGGQLIGQIQLDGSLYSREPSWHEDTIDPGSFHTSEGSELQDFAMMLWLSRCPQIGDATICRCWDAGYGVGADTLNKGVFVQLSVPEESVELLSNRQLLVQYDLESTEELEGCEELLGELKELYEEQIEEGGLEPCDFISEFAQEYRSQARDDIQQAFLHAMHDSVADLSKITPFDELKKMGGSWSLSQIEDWQESAEAFLKPIDFDDPNSISLAFSKLPEEHWKQHRSRVRSLLNNLPEKSKNDADVFRAIIPEVAAWVLEYAGPDVCSDPTLIDLAVDADLEHGYAATALRYASEALRRDEGWVLEILKKQPTEYRNLPDEMRANKGFAVKFAAGGNLWDCIPEELIKDRDVLKAYVESNPSFPYSSIPEDCHDDLELAEAFINAGGDFGLLPSQLQVSSDLFLLYLSNANKRGLSGRDIRFAFERYLESTGLKKTEIPIDFLQSCFATNQGIIEFLNLNCFSADELVKVVIGIEAPTINQKLEALEVLAEHAPKGDGTSILLTDIISELEKPVDYPKKEIVKVIETAQQPAVRALSIMVDFPDVRTFETLKGAIELAGSCLEIVENLLSEQAKMDEAAK